ncbi:MAG: prepilin peptidase [Desulfobacteraceae bacterium]|nr:prepilin peptidase [Desulfobacteraceae bacterium]
MIDYTLTLILFIFGACIGSFLNVCIFRIPEKLSIVFPGSFCPICKKNIPFYCNIPILSYLFLRGRCKNCKTPIPIRYPLIEILTGIFPVFLFFKFGFTPVVFFWFSFICVLIVISLIDFDHQIIPDIISIPCIFIFASSAFFIPEMSIKSVLLGIFTGGGILYTVAFVYFKLKKTQGMGGGDIKLLAMIGAATGIKGVLFTLFTGSLLGTFAGIFAILFVKGGNRYLKIPFGPYLSAGAIIYIFFGESLIQWYLY